MLEALRKLTLKNFQTHRELRWDLAPGVNTIVGPSDVGKSAIIRALRWLACNEPSGDAFRRWGSKVTEVVATLADGTSITRGRSKSGNNFYTLDGKRFVSFGSEPPVDVAAVLGITADNFQRQHDAPFWLSETAGEIGRQLNRIVNLELIDVVMTKLAALVRGATATVAVLSEAVAERKADVGGLLFVEAVNVDLAGVECTATELAGVAGQRAEISVLVGKCERIEAYHSRAAELATVGRMAVLVGQEADECKRQRVELLATIDAVERYTADAAVEVPELSELETVAGNVRDAHNEIVELLAGMDAVLSRERELEEATVLATRAEADFAERMGDVCLLCGKPTSP